MSGTIELTDDNFENEVLKSDKPVLVDFWASWCSPCKMVEPVVEEIALDFAERIKVGKLNVDDHNRTASQYGIMSIPSILFFKGGRWWIRLSEQCPKASLKRRWRKS